MEIKNTAITATMVIQSLVKLLENEDVDISSVKFKVGSESNGYESPEFELEKLIDLAYEGLGKIKEQATPEGFVLVSKKLSDEMNDHLWDFMTDNFISTNEDGDSYIACDDFDLRKFYSEIIEAQEQKA
jgi:hypothetical protein